MSDEAWLATNIQASASWLQANLVRNLTADEAIRERLKSKPEDYGHHIPHSVLIDPTTDKNAVLLAKEVKIELDRQAIPITIHGYAPTDRIFTHYVAQYQHDDNTIVTFFNYIRPDVQKREKKELKANTNKAYNIRKAFTITVANTHISALTDYLNFKGTIDLNEPSETEQVDEIVIEITRKKSNEFITTGEIRVRGTNIQGATLELGGGTIEEECTGCPDNTTYGCKRVPAGTYKFELNNDTQGGTIKYRHRAIRLSNTYGYEVEGHTSKRSGVLIHRGNAHSYSQGCILAMYSDKLPKVLADMNAYLDDARMGYNTNEEETAILPLALYEYIERVDPGGTKTKTVIIRNEDEGSTLSVDTQTFENRRQAGEYYVNLGVAAKAEEIIEELAYKVVEDLLDEKGVVYVVEAKKMELATRSDMTAEQKQAALAKVWDDKVQSLGTAISATEAKKKVKDYYDDFVSEVRQYVVDGVIRDSESKEIADNVYKYLSDPLTGTSSPAVPLFKKYLKRVNATPGSGAESKIKQLIEKNLEVYERDIKNDNISP